MDNVGTKRARIDTPGASPTPLTMRRGNSDLGGIPSAQPDAFMLKFQNEALNTKVNEQKREISDLESKMSALEQRNAESEKELGFIKSQWNLLGSELSILAPRVGGEVSSDGLHFDHLLWPEVPTEEALTQLSHKTKEIFGSIVRAIEETSSQNAEILRRIQEAASSDEQVSACKLHLDTVNNRCEAYDRSLNDLQAQFRTMSSKVSEVANAVASHDKKIKFLESEKENLTDALKFAERRADKLEKEKDALKASAAAQGATVAAGGSTTPVQMGAVTPSRPPVASPGPGLPPKKIKDFAGGGGAGISNEQEEVLRLELADAQDIAESRLAELNNATAEIHRLQDIITQMEIEGIAPEKVKSHPAFRELQYVAGEQRKELGNLYSVADRLSNDLQVMSSMRKSEFDRLEIEYQDRLHDQQMRLEELIEERDRMLRQKEDLEYKLRQVDFSRQMLTAREAAAMIDSMKARHESDVSDKRKKIQHLEMECGALEGQLRDKSRALADARDKIDQLSVRVQEMQTRLNMAGRPQNAPAELEASYQRAVADLETSNTRARGLEGDLEDARVTVLRLTSELESLKAEHEAVMAEMDAMQESCQDSDEKSRKLIGRVSEAEDQRASITKELLSVKMAMSRAEQETNLLREKASAQDTVIAEQKSHIALLEKNAKLLKEQTLKYAEAERALQGSRQDLVRSVQGGAEQAQRLESQVQTQQQQINEYRKRMEDSTIALEEQQSRARKLEDEAVSMRRRLEKQGGGNSRQDLMSSVMEEEMRELKKMVKCTVCMERNKSVVITKCFHVFCKKCIDANLQTRHRKCPACGEKFGQADTRALFLV